MRARPFARLTTLVAVASVVAGCSAANGEAGPPAPQLQLRVVTSSTVGPCSAPPLTSQGPGSACDRAGTTTYDVAESLGVVTPTSVTLEGKGPGQTILVEFDTADASRLRDVTGEVDTHLAVLLNGKVLAAPVVKEPLTGKVSFGFETAAEAEKVAAELGASARS